MYRNLRENAYDHGWSEYEEFAVQPSFRDFVVFCIAEGYRRSQNSSSILNSEPAIVAIDELPRCKASQDAGDLTGSIPLAVSE